jgi:hypothetical protein
VIRVRSFLSLSSPTPSVSSATHLTPRSSARAPPPLSPLRLASYDPTLTLLEPADHVVGELVDTGEGALEHALIPDVERAHGSGREKARDGGLGGVLEGTREGDLEEVLAEAEAETAAASGEDWGPSSVGRGRPTTNPAVVGRERDPSNPAVGEGAGRAPLSPAAVALATDPSPAASSLSSAFLRFG